MSEEQLKELQEYNLEYLEAQNSEEIFGGDYTSAVELKYAELKIEEMRKELINQDKYIAKLQEEYANQLQQKENIIKEVREYIEKMEKLHFDYSYEKQELLEILDREENDNNNFIYINWN